MSQTQVVTEEVTFIKRSQAATMAGVTPKTITSWCNSGRLKYQTDARGRYLIDKSTLDLPALPALGEEEASEEEVAPNQLGTFFREACLLLRQAHSHIEKKEIQSKTLCDYITTMHTSRDQATIDALQRTAKENESQHRELTKLRAEILKMETDAASELFATDTHERNEGRKERLTETIVAVIQSKMGNSPEAKAVVDAVVEVTQQK